MARSTKTSQERIDAYLAAPSLKAWKALYGLIIPGTWRTLWQAWISVDGGAPTELPANEAGVSEFRTYPDAFTLRRAIKAATEGKVPVGLGELIRANCQAPIVRRS